MKKLMVFAEIRRIESVCGGQDKFELELQYGTEADGVARVEFLNEETASNASYYARKSICGLMTGAVFYDYKTRKFLQGMAFDNYSTLIAGGWFNSANELESVINSLVVGANNLDLEGKVVLNWSGDSELCKYAES